MIQIFLSCRNLFEMTIYEYEVCAVLQLWILFLHAVNKPIHILNMESFFLYRIVGFIWIKEFVGSAIHVLKDDNLSDMMQLHGQFEKIDKRLSPIPEFVLVEN